MNQSFGWQRLDPARWARECEALGDAGWEPLIRHEKGRLSAYIKYPLTDTDGERRTARLEIRWPHSYPWAPVEVYDYEGDLRVSRHRDPTRRGLLCLAHEDQFDPHQTAAELVAQQVPKLFLANSPGAADGRAAAAGHELPVPDPITAYAAAQRQVLVPPGQIPDDVSGGALVVRLRLDRHDALVTTLIQSILGPGVCLEMTRVDVEDFQHVVYGQWLRDPDFHPGESAEQVWRRIEPTLPPLETGPPLEPDKETLPSSITLMGLLVPSERVYRQASESWIFLLRIRTGHGPDGLPTYVNALLDSQVLDVEAGRVRTPIAEGLKDKDVVLVGCGAIGHHIANDLARTGARRLDLVDRDFVDVLTSSRQWAPYVATGHSKAHTLAEHISANSPGTAVKAWLANAVHIYEPYASPIKDAARRRLLRRIQAADLIVDASANGTLTGLLNAISLQFDIPLLSVAGTAGMWGGWVALMRPRQTGCWECLAHHRADKTDPEGNPWPVPPSDAHGWTVPVGCAEPTFTGTTADVQALSHHASRVAIHQLAEEATLGGDYYVAALRDAEGRAVPAEWRAVQLPVHAECLNHQQ